MSSVEEKRLVEGTANSISSDVATRLNGLASLDAARLRAEWRRHYRTEPARSLSRDLLVRAVAYKIQERAYGGMNKASLRKLKKLGEQFRAESGRSLEPLASLKPGAKLVREWGGKTHRVLVLDDGFEYCGTRYPSLSRVARLITGAHWSGPRFFGLKRARKPFASNAERDHET